MTPCMFIFVTLFVRGIMKVMGISLLVSMLFYQILNETPAISRERACLIFFFFLRNCATLQYMYCFFSDTKREGGNALLLGVSNTYKVHRNQYDI